MATDLSSSAAGRLAVTDAADVEVTLDQRAVWQMFSLGDAVHFTTDGEAVAVATTTAADAGILGAAASVYGAPTFLSGVRTLRLLCDSGETATVILTRAFPVPIIEA